MVVVFPLPSSFVQRPPPPAHYVNGCGAPVIDNANQMEKGKSNLGQAEADKVTRHCIRQPSLAEIRFDADLHP